MSDQLPLFEPMTFEDTPSATSSPGSASGVTRSGSLDGQTTGKSGPDPVPANPSRQPDKPRRSTTTGIFGQSSFDSSAHDDLSFALASRLRRSTDSLGSTLFTLTWMTRVTPAGRSICALRASEPPTGDSVCTGWPSPQAHDVTTRGNTEADHHYFPHDLSNAATMAAWPTPQSSDTTGGGQAKRSSSGRANLNDFAMLAGWGTPKPRDYRSENEASLMREGHPPDLNKMALLAGWKTPCVPNGGRISGNLKDIGKHQNGTKAQIGLENEAKLSGWPTPMAGTPAQNGYNEAGNNDSSRKTVEMCQWLVGPSTAFGDKPIGYLLGPNGWETVPASGQLSAAHSRWLMGLPAEWDDCGVTAMASLRRSRKRS